MKEQDVTYAFEKTYNATRCLICENDIRKRVQMAISELTILKVGKHLDAELASKLNNICKAENQEISVPEKGKIAVNTGLMSDSDAEKIAQDIFDLFIAICEKHYKN